MFRSLGCRSDLVRGEADNETAGEEAERGPKRRIEAAGDGKGGVQKQVEQRPGESGRGHNGLGRLTALACAVLVLIGERQLRRGTRITVSCMAVADPPLQ